MVARFDGNRGQNNLGSTFVFGEKTLYGIFFLQARLINNPDLQSYKFIKTGKYNVKNFNRTAIPQIRF